MIFKQITALFLVVLLMAFASTMVSVLAKDEKDNKDNKDEAVHTEAVEKAPSASESPHDAHSSKPTATTKATPEKYQCIAGTAALEDIKKSREELEEKKKELVSREAELKSKEQIIQEEIKKLEQLRDTISKVGDQKKIESQEKVAKLVETLQTMSAKAAAKLLATLEDSLAVAAMNQMDTARLAKILNLMEPSKSSQLTEMMAGVMRAKKAALRMETPVVSQNLNKKGGEKKDGTKFNENTNANDRIDFDQSRKPASTASTAGGGTAAEKNIKSN